MKIDNKKDREDIIICSLFKAALLAHCLLTVCAAGAIVYSCFV